MKRRLHNRLKWASALAAGLASSPAWGQAPVAPTGPVAAPAASTKPGGPIRRAIRHTCFTLKDRFIGYPDQFVEPPVGFYVYEAFGQMKSRADAHDFMVYRSDFVDGSTTLSPVGAQRLTLMATRLGGWLGPVTVEWTPEEPGLAESRRTAVLALFQGAGLACVPERIVVGPSPYPGLLGADAVNNYDTLMLRDQAAGRNYSLPPTSTATFGGGAR